MDWSIFLIILQLIVLEGLLSIDNAAVLGALVVHLPNDKEIEWPKSMMSFGHRINKLFGPQRTAALRVGLLGAYVGRGLMLLLASFIVQNPWLKVIGAAYLIRLAFENLGAIDESESDGELREVKAKTFWGVVIAVELADLAFSLDNVVAAVALSDKLWVVMVGVAIGILFMRFAAGVFSYAVEKEPILKPAAYILVFNIGVELLLSEFAGLETPDWMKFTISLGTIALSLAYAHFKPLQFFRPVLIWIAQGFTKLNSLVDWALVPLFAILTLLKNGFLRIFTKPGIAMDKEG